MTRLTDKLWYSKEEIIQFRQQLLIMWKDICHKRNEAKDMYNFNYKKNLKQYNLKKLEYKEKLIILKKELKLSSMERYMKNLNDEADKMELDFNQLMKKAFDIKDIK